MSLEFEYLLRKSQCEMLISRDDISNDVITIPLALAFNVCIHLQLFPLCAVWRKSDSELSCRRAIGELEVEFKFQRCSCKLSFLFLLHCQSATGELACRLGYRWHIQQVAVSRHCNMQISVSLTHSLNSD